MGLGQVGVRLQYWSRRPPLELDPVFNAITVAVSGQTLL